ncbi:hypothetical protein IPM19_00220 [bacterium]|nr:MAG: hypothetical protein IPM19_00220 [bacterium]
MNHKTEDTQGKNQRTSEQTKHDEEVAIADQAMKQSTCGTIQQRTAFKARGGFRRSKRFYNGGII